jgi:hypothetical protein
MFFKIYFSSTRESASPVQPLWELFLSQPEPYQTRPRLGRPIYKPNGRPTAFTEVGHHPAWYCRHRRVFNKQIRIDRSCSCWILSMVAEVGGKLQCLWPCGEYVRLLCALSDWDSGVRVSLCPVSFLQVVAGCMVIPYLYFHLQATDREEIPWINREWLVVAPF